MYKIRKANKCYQCSECGYRKIERGQRYLYDACPPWHEGSRSKKWQVIRACFRCAVKYGMLTEDMRNKFEKLKAEGKPCAGYGGNP